MCKMKQLSKFNRDRVMLSASRWSVARVYFDPLFNYLVYGFEPGSFWTAVLANDFMRAVEHSHPGNDIPALKHAVGWIQDSFPAVSYGSRGSVDHWCNLSTMERHVILEQHRILLTEQEVMMATLRGEQSYEPMFD